VGQVRSWKFWVGVLVSVVFLWVALRGLDLERFWQTLGEANYWWIVPGVLVYFVAVLVRTWRWHYMLRHIKPIPTMRLFPVVVIGYMGNNVYPVRAGEVLRSYVLRRKEGVAMSASLTTAILERIFDGLVMLLFVFVTLPFAPLPPVYQNMVLVFSGLFGLALLVFFVIAARPERIRLLYAWGVNRVLPEALRPKVHDLFDHAIEGLQSLRSPREMALIFLTSTLIWLTETTKYWFVMHAFPLDVPFSVLMLMTAVVNLFTTIPSSPGYVGTFDAPGIAVLKQFNVGHAVATGYTLVLHVALWLPITLLGAYYMLRESISWKDIERATREGESLENQPLETQPLEREDEPRDEPREAETTPGVSS
jgi:glycosyltransferase 2 family protein